MDPSKNAPETMVCPALDAEAVNVSSANWTPTVAGKSFARSLYVGVTGNIKVDMVGVGTTTGQTGITFANVPVGILPISVTKVYETGTTASSITALY